jgi:hypothetical protein
MDVQVTATKEEVPGLAQAKEVQGLLRKAGIQDVQLFFDPQLRIWAICQVMKPSGRILIPDSYQQDGIKPYILWWCKDEQSKFRPP